MLARLIEKLFGKQVAEKMLGSLVRHLIGWLGGLVAGLGLAPELVAEFLGSMEKMAMALIPLLVSLVLSALEKKNR